MVAETCTHHPYHMYEAIMAQPDTSVATSAERDADALAAKLSGPDSDEKLAPNIGSSSI